MSATNDFGYNLRSEVTNAVMGENTYGYAYDPIGNRGWATVNAASNLYSANSLNQYSNITCQANSLQPNSPPPSYDPDGNMLTNGPWAYTWDAENRLVSACSNGVLLVSNAYDHRSRRIRKEVSVRESPNFEFQVSSFRTYLWDGWNIIREVQYSSIPTFQCSTNYYTWGLDLSGTLQGVPLRQGYGGQAGGVGGLLAVTTCSTDNNQPVTCDTYFPCYDANGNISEYVATNGTVRGRYEYSPFGETTAQSGDLADAFTHRFSTKPFDAETGLAVYQLRPYSPPLGRFIKHDLIEEQGGLNLYEFVRNNPFNRVDFVGLKECDCSGTKIISAGAIAARTALIYSMETRKTHSGDTTTSEERFEYCGILCCGKTPAGVYEVYTVPDNIRDGKGYNSTSGHHCSISGFSCKANDQKVGWFHSHPSGSSFSNSDLMNAGYGFLGRDEVPDKPNAPRIVMYEHSWKDKKTGNFCADIYSVDLHTKQTVFYRRQCGTE